MLITNIKWDTDGEVVDLPNKVEVPDEYNEDYDGIADYLSDEYGFCVETFSVDMKDDDIDEFGMFVNEVEGKVS